MILERRSRVQGVWGDRGSSAYLQQLIVFGPAAEAAS